MHIHWEEAVPLTSMLPRTHPLRGILEGCDGLRDLDRYFFSTDIRELPRPRPAEPGLVALLEEWHLETGAPPAAMKSLQMLREGAQAVVTGQQAGLLGGPVLTFIKGATAVAVARVLTERTGRRHVPVFWAETDDHDFEEANRAGTLDREQQPHRLSLPWPERFRGGATGGLPVEEAGAELIRNFFTFSGETEFSAALRDRLHAEHRGSGSLSRWFARQLLGFFGDAGLIVFDALEPRFKPFAADLWVRVLEEPLRLTEELREAGERVSAAGFTPVLAKKKRRCPFFLFEGGRRETVFLERRSFKAGGRSYTLLELRRRLDERPGDFSAAVNLRPLLQDFLLPTAAYVGGPTEMAYFQQVLPGYDWAEMPPPALVLRPSLTLVEPPVRKLLHRQGIGPMELRAGVEGIIGSVLRRENRLADPQRWEKIRRDSLRPLERFAAGLDAEEHEISELCRRASGKVDFQLKELEKKAVASLRRRSDVLRGQLERTRNRLFPFGELQERSLSPCYFLNRYGEGLLESLSGELPGDFTRHHFGSIIL